MMCLPRRAAWRGPYCDGLCLLSGRTRAATSEAVKPLGEEDKASSASMTRRMRALLRSDAPLLAAAQPLRPKRGAHNPKPIDLHYDAIQAAMKGVFHELGLAA